MPQKVVLLSLDHNHELSLTSNHTSFASRRLNPADMRDLGRPRESHGLGNESHVSELAEAEGHFLGISQRTASPGSVQIHVEGPNGAAACTAFSHECACF